MNQIKQGIQENDFLQHLDKVQIKEIIECMYSIELLKNNVVIKEGDIGSMLYFLEGTVNVNVTDTISWRGHRDKSHAIELTLFLWHMPDDATEGVVEHSCRLQPSIYLHAPVTAFMFSYPMYYPERMKARVSPVQ